MVDGLASGQSSGPWSLLVVVSVLNFYWWVVHFYFQKWSVVTALNSIWPVVGALRLLVHGWSVISGFALRASS